MIQQDIFYHSNDGKTKIHAVIWRPECKVKGVVQIIHGMAEYAERYAPFAKALCDEGYLVAANDHLGHGKSVTTNDYLGYFVKGNGNDVVLADARSLTEIVKKECGDVPYFILGHSMGSFFARQYIALYGKELSGAVIMGTAYQQRIVTAFAKFITKTVALFKGWHYRSKFIDNLAFGAYNKKIKDKRTQFDWLSQNAKNVDDYIADELCGIKFTCSGFYTLFSALQNACKNKTIKATPKDLPIYLVAGKDDPVGGYSKGVIKLYDKFAKSGVEDIDMTIYAGARHEILNDFCSEQVVQDIIKFIGDKALK
jgi:alpha-beta hydrolase superfamily lysophospholipase